MKELGSIQIGPDGKASVFVDAGKLNISVSYSVDIASRLDAIKAATITKLEEAIPGDWDSAILEPIWADLVKRLTE